jgi:hypothetical protein
MGKLDHIKDLDDFSFRNWKALAHKLGGDVEMLKHILRGDVEIGLVSAHLERIHEHTELRVCGAIGREFYGFNIVLEDTEESIPLHRSNGTSEPTAAAEVVAYAYKNQSRTSVKNLFLIDTKPFTETQVIAFCRHNPSVLSSSNLFLVRIDGYDGPIVINVTKQHGVHFWRLSKAQILFPNIYVFFLR